MMQPVHVSAHSLTTAMYGSAPARAIIIATRFRLDRLWLAMLNDLKGFNVVRLAAASARPC